MIKNKLTVIFLISLIFLILSASLVLSECPKPEYKLNELRSDLRTIVLNFLSDPASSYHTTNEILDLIDFYNDGKDMSLVSDCDVRGARSNELISTLLTKTSAAIEDCGTCEKKNADGNCVYQGINEDLLNECADTGCGTGYCNGNGACGYYNTGERNCAACQTCEGTISTSCVNIADNTQDTGGSSTCSATCKTCNGAGSCVNQGVEDLFGQCGTSNCNTGNCGDDTGTCGYYISGQHGCPASYVCNAFGNCEFTGGTKANGESCSLGSECSSAYCTDGVCCNTACTGSTCQRCDSYSSAGVGTCGYVSSSSQDPDNNCAQGSTASDGCRSSYCSGSGYSCGVQTSGEGNCPVCKTCTGANSVSCVNIAQCSQDTEGVNTCIWGNLGSLVCDGTGVCKSPYIMTYAPITTPCYDLGGAALYQSTCDTACNNQCANGGKNSICNFKFAAPLSGSCTCAQSEIDGHTCSWIRPPLPLGGVEGYRAVGCECFICP